MKRFRLAVTALSVAVSSAHAQRTATGPTLGLRLERTVFSIGDAKSGGPETFGSIAGLAMDKRGRVYVLDASDNSIRIFDDRGRFVARTARSGRGPGELARPASIYHDGDSTLYVVDEMNGIIAFRTRAGSFPHLRTVQLPFRARALCVADRKLFVTGFFRGRTVHELTEAFGVSRSFGGPFPVLRAPGTKERVDTVTALIEWANRASLLLACPSAEPRILTVQAAGPGSRSYESSGAERWRATLADYQGTTFAVAGPGRGTIVWGEDGTYAVSLLQDSIALVQVLRRRFGRLDGARRQAPTSTVALRTVMMNVRTGRILSETRTVPPILAASGSRLAIVEYEPFPRVTIRTFTIRNQ